MARRRRRRSSRNRMIYATLLIGISGCVWWMWPIAPGAPEGNATRALASKPSLTSDRPDIGSANHLSPGVTEKGANPVKPDDAPSNDMARQRATSLVAAGRQALTINDPVAAREHFSEALSLDVADTDRVFLRAELTRLADETIFSPRIFDNDPLVITYVVKAGDNLAKIAKGHQVSTNLLATLNGLANKNLIRIGQRLKILVGPFHARIDRRNFSLDTYLGSTFVRHFKVGLGEDGSTPSGEWQVGTKLQNPTYHPPRGGAIVAADDPENPLGERWIGLVGISGEAMGQRGYGIHGTIEPDSIGQNASLGCVRLYNADVEALYDYLVEKHSHVTVR